MYHRRTYKLACVSINVPKKIDSWHARSIHKYILWLIGLPLNVIMCLHIGSFHFSEQAKHTRQTHYPQSPRRAIILDTIVRMLVLLPGDVCATRSLVNYFTICEGLFCLAVHPFLLAPYGNGCRRSESRRHSRKLVGLVHGPGVARSLLFSHELCVWIPFLTTQL